MSIYIVSSDEINKTDISGVLANRELIERIGLGEFYWEAMPKDGENHSEIPEIRRYLRRLLEEWPDILRYCGPFARNMFILGTCRRERGSSYGELFAPTPFFKRALKRAGLNGDFSPRKNKRKA